MFWWLLAWGSAVALALNTEYEIEKAIQLLKYGQVEKIPSLEGRVINYGNYTTVPYGTYPFAVLVIVKTASEGVVCSGTLVTAHFVVSAASCARGYVYEANVLAGDVNYSMDKTFDRSNVQVRTMCRYMTSPGPEHIILIDVWYPFHLDKHYVDIAVLAPNKTYDKRLNISTVAIGFANIGKDGEMTAYNFWTIPGASCSSDLGEKVLCSKLEPYKSVCDADRGGPVVYKKKVYGFIRGRDLQSSKVPCGAPVKYNTFWFIGGFHDWINSIISHPSNCTHYGLKWTSAKITRHYSPAAAVLAQEAWMILHLLSCSINLLLT